MTDISKAIDRLKQDGIESFEQMGILVIPCDSSDEIYDLANTVRRIFKEVDYDKSWRIDPYYYNRHGSINSTPTTENRVKIVP